MDKIVYEQIKVQLKDNTERLILMDEGYKPFLYDDKTGLRVKAPVGNITGGLGRNYDAKPPTIQESILDMRATVFYIKERLRILLSFFDSLDEARKAVLIDIAYNNGVHGLLGFKNTILLLEQKRNEEASKELLNSDDARNPLLAGRYLRLSNILLTGQWPKECLS